MNSKLRVILYCLISSTFAFFLGFKLASPGKDIIGDQHIKISQTQPADKNNQLNLAKSEGSTKIDKNILSQPSQYGLKPEKEFPPLPPNLKRIMEGSDMIERMGAYLDAVRAMDSSNVAEVVSAFESLPKGYGRHMEMKLLMRSWAAFDPIGALDYANSILDAKSERRFGISEILAGWSHKSPEAAIQWVQSNYNQEKPEDSALMLGVIKGLAESDIVAANRFLTSIPQGNARWQASTFLAQEYAKRNAKEAIEWANQYPTDDPRLRETIVGQMGARLARTDLEATANWAETMPYEPASQRVMDNLLNQWVPKDPNAAAEWVKTITNDEKKIYAMQRLTANWANRDPIATAEWLNSFPPSSDLDPVVGEFVSRISGKDPEIAASWALAIKEEKEREKAVKRVLSRWEKTNPQKAEAWKQTHQINL